MTETVPAASATTSTESADSLATSPAVPGAGTPASGGVVVTDLTVVYGTDRGEFPAVAGATITFGAGRITGLVGESGSGKSTLALAVMNAVPKPGRIASGSIVVDGVGDMTALSGKRLRQARGGDIGYVFQASQNSMNPLKTVGRQILDLGRSHDVKDLRGLLHRARVLAERMGLDAERVLDSYQHELSGGMRQRLGIVLALVLNAEVLILDEPTTALDMLSQAAVLEIIRDVHRENGLTTVIVTHDMGVVSEVADDLAVMYGGRIVEVGPVEELLGEASHPYTKALIGAIARIVGATDVAQPLPGRPPDLTTIPKVGCVFRERCGFAMEVCGRAEPALVEWAPGRRRACHVAAEAVVGHAREAIATGAGPELDAVREPSAGAEAEPADDQSVCAEPGPADDQSAGAERNIGEDA